MPVMARSVLSRRGHSRLLARLSLRRVASARSRMLPEGMVRPLERICCEGLG